MSATITPGNRAFLPFYLPSIGNEEIDEVIKTLNSGWLTTGPRVKQFEEEFKNYVGARYAVAVNSCTAALHLVLAAWGISENDEVITTPLTFCATIEAIEYVRAKPVLVDIDPKTGNIDPDRIEEKITNRTRAIIPVHYGGWPCRMDKILEIAARHKLLVLDDAAHASGTGFMGRKIGSMGNASAFSFYVNKNMTTGEGGMITTNDENLANQCRLLSLHGISRDAWKRYSAEGSWYYEVETLGYKYNMTDVAAALGIHQLRRLDEMNKRRGELFDLYRQLLSKIDCVDVFPKNMPSDVQPSWHLITVLINRDQLSIDRARFFEELKARNIGCSVHYIPIHLHPHYRQYGWKVGDFPNCEAYYENTLSLPLYPSMSENDVGSVVAAIEDIGKTFRLKEK